MQKTIRWRLAQWLERRWWRRYIGRQPSPEAYLLAKKQYWQQVLQILGHEPRPGAAVLDAGCGPAGIFILLHESQELTALDPLLEAYERDLAIFKKAQYPQVNFVAQPIENTSFPNASFKTIYCFNAINHVSDWEAALDQLRCWIQPGGRLLISSDVHRWRLLHRIFSILPGDALHPQQHLASDYEKALQARGWKIDNSHVLRRGLIFDYRAWVCVF